MWVRLSLVTFLEQGRGECTRIPVRCLRDCGMKQQPLNAHIVIQQLCMDMSDTMTPGQASKEQTQLPPTTASAVSWADAPRLTSTHLVHRASLLKPLSVAI
jgi:hypothetical protein